MKNKTKIKEFNKRLEKLLNNYKDHDPECKNYLSNKKFFNNFFLDHKNNKNPKIYLGKMGKIKLPFYRMGEITSYELLGIDEIIIFCFYLKMSNFFSKASDLGANIGLHSIILDKMKYKIKSFEPDKDHLIQFQKNLLINKSANIKIFNKAVDINVGKVEFTKIINNTTSSFIKNSKKKYYGPTKKYLVKTYPFNKILKWSNILKIDVEGMEGELIQSTQNNDWLNKIAILEIGNKKNAESIFRHSKKIKLNIFCQKNGWSKANKIKDMPSSYKHGSAILTTYDKNPWLY